ncbi:MAG: KEOPS complex subunit Pcc1 [Candidatus Micrarchaeia archaeon]
MSNDNDVVAVLKTEDRNYKKILGIKRTSRYKRSTMSAKVEGHKFVIEIHARDFTAMRATINSVLRDLQIASAKIPIKRQKSKSL